MTTFIEEAQKKSNQKKEQWNVNAFINRPRTHKVKKIIKQTSVLYYAKIDKMFLIGVQTYR